MKTSIRGTKKPGEPPKATGSGEQIGLRWPKPLLRRIDAWIEDHDERLSRPEAIRRLVEQALASATSPRQSNPESRRKAAELAAQEIDRLGQPSGSSEEQARRKRRLIKGPREFREVRGDKPKAK